MCEEDASWERDTWEGKHWHETLAPVRGSGRRSEGTLWPWRVVHATGQPSGQRTVGVHVTCDTTCWLPQTDTARAQGAGVIIHISSIQQRLPLFEATLAYAAAVAELVACLASERATAITGSEYVIDRGTIPTI